MAEILPHMARLDRSLKRERFTPSSPQGLVSLVVLVRHAFVRSTFAAIAGAIVRCNIRIGVRLGIRRDVRFNARFGDGLK